MTIRSGGWNLSVGLALGAGASHGWAHIGVIRELLDHGIVPDVVMGSSAGALVGAYHAARKLDVLERWARAQTLRSTMTHLRLRPGHSLFGASLFREMTEHFGNIVIDDLPVRFGAVATDLALGTRRVITTGPLSRAVAASGAFPLLFPPVKIDGAWFADGCLTDPVPAALCRSFGVDIVIGVRVLDFGDSVRNYNDADAEASHWRNLLFAEDDEEAEESLRTRESAWPRTVFGYLMRVLGFERAIRALHRLASKASRGRDVPGLATIALRALAARRRAAHNMLHSSQSADVFIVPELGPLRLGAPATAHAIGQGALAARGRVHDIRKAASRVADQRSRQLQRLPPLRPFMVSAY